MNQFVLMAVLMAVGSVIGIVSVHILGRDNVVTETVEEIIQIETGQKIDFDSMVLPAETNPSPH